MDACLSDVPGNNYISFRFEGGGAARDRRSLRACFLERCLVHHGQRTAEISLRCPHPSHGGVPPIGVLGQPEVLPEVSAALQVAPCGIEIIAFDVENAHADVHVGRSTKHGPAR